jgi:hypothetical protein
MNVPSTLGEFFTFIGSAGAIGFVLSFVAENWGFFQSRNKQGKVAILMFIALLMGLGSYSLVRFVPAGVVEQAQPIYQVIIATLSILLASQVWHKTVNQQVIDVTATTVSNTATRDQPVAPVKTSLAAQGKG